MYSVFPEARMRLQSSMPSVPGIIQSLMMMRMASFWMAAHAASPSVVAMME